MNNANATLAAAREELACMKMVPVVVIITTQYRENCGERWKCKGGSTYIVEGYEAYPDMLDAAASTIEAAALAYVAGAIEYSNEGSEEFIIGAIVDEADNASEYYNPWESPTFIQPDNGILHCRQIVHNDEYGYLRPEIERIERHWVEDRDGNRSKFNEEVIYR